MRPRSNPAQSNANAIASVMKPKIRLKTMVRRSRFFSTDVEAAAEAPRPPPNMSDRPPPRPLCMSTSTMQMIPTMAYRIPNAMITGADLRQKNHSSVPCVDGSNAAAD